MGLLDYSRGSGIIGSSVQEYIDERFPVCPICGTRQPDWEFKAKLALDGNRVQFCCNECTSSFSIFLADMIKLTKAITNPLGLLVAPQVAIGYSAMKVLKKQKISEMYVKVESIGGGIDGPLKEGQELPIDQLRELALRR